MTREELEKKVIGCVATVFHKEEGELSLDTNFKNDLGGQSILMVSLGGLIEETIDVLIPLPTISTCATIKDLVDNIEKLK